MSILREIRFDLQEWQATANSKRYKYFLRGLKCTNRHRGGTPVNTINPWPACPSTIRGGPAMKHGVTLCTPSTVRR